MTQIKEHGTPAGMIFVEVCTRCFATAPIEKNLFFDLLITLPGKLPEKANTNPIHANDLLRWTTPLRRMRRDCTPGFEGVEYEVRPVALLREALRLAPAAQGGFASRIEQVRVSNDEARMCLAERARRLA